MGWPGGAHAAELADRLAAYVQGAQHGATGLPVSYASDDAGVRGIAFTYDVAVSALVLAHAGRWPAARHALDVYQGMALPTDGQFHFNVAYVASSGRPGPEYRVHGGPMFWLAIAMFRLGQACADAAWIEKGAQLLAWARATLPHADGGVAMSHRDDWSRLMSVENNWVYYAALRVAAEVLPPSRLREELGAERRQVRIWLARRSTDRGIGDPVRALDVYTHPLLIGPEAALEDGPLNTSPELLAWARAHVQELERTFRVGEPALYDYTDAAERGRIGRDPTGWLEGTEQVALAYLTWAVWCHGQGDAELAERLRRRAAEAHAQVCRLARETGAGWALPNTAARDPIRTFHDGWWARPASEPALNSTNWAYLVEVAYNPFTMPLPLCPER